MRLTSLIKRSAACRAALHGLSPMHLEGCVTGLSGLMVDIDGLGGHVSVGDRLVLTARDGHRVPAEIVGFRNGLAQAMPLAPLDGLGPGSAAQCHGEMTRLPATGAGFVFGWLVGPRPRSAWTTA
jgi:flagellar biosynthesis/type III secretory pathway ATPase